MSRNKKTVTITTKTPAATTPAKSNSITKSVRLGVEVVNPSVTPTQVKHLVEHWIKYGDANNQPTLLNDLSTISTLHANLIRLRQNLIAGDGFLLPAELQEGNDIVNSDGETLDDLLDKSKIDLSIQECVAYQVVYNRKKTDITDIFFLDSSSVRASKELDDFNRPDGYYVCSDWQNVEENKPVFYPRFNPYDITSPSQVFYSFASPKPGQPYLPQVSYFSGAYHIDLSDKLNKFAHNFVSQGMFAGGILHVKGSLEQSVQSNLISDLSASHVGEQNVGKFVVVVGENGSEIDLTSLSTNDLTPILTAMREECITNICMAHGAQPIIAAVEPGGSSLGSDGKMYRDSLEAYDKLVIKGLRKPLLSFWNQVFRFKGLDNINLQIKSSALLAKELPDYLIDLLTPEYLAEREGIDIKNLRPENLTTTAEDASKAGENVAISDGQETEDTGETEETSTKQILSRINGYRKK